MLVILYIKRHLSNNCIKRVENLNLPLLTTLKLDYQKIPEDEYMTFDENCIKNLSVIITKSFNFIISHKNRNIMLIKLL